MRYLAPVVLALVVLAGAALAAGGVPLNPNKRYELTDCAAGGSSSISVDPGTYLMRITDADVFVCYAGTCASGGEKFPMGTVMQLTTLGTTATTMSCRSASSTGDFILTAAN